MTCVARAVIWCSPTSTVEAVQLAPLQLAFPPFRRRYLKIAMQMRQATMKKKQENVARQQVEEEQAVLKVMTARQKIRQHRHHHRQCYRRSEDADQHLVTC